MEAKQTTFEGWAVLEIFGHQRYAGYVTSEAFGQAVLFRVEVPPLEARDRITKHWEYVDDKQVPPGSTVRDDAVQGYTKFFGPGAIYAMTPCSQEAAEKAVASMQARNVTVVQLAPEAKTLPPADTDDDDLDDPDDGIDDDAELPL